MIEMVSKYESMLSDSFVNLVGQQTLNLQTVMSMLTNVKCVPSFTDGKGSISTLDISSDDKNTLENIQATRNAIANAVGIPSYYLSLSGEHGSSKLETLKVYSRYSRKLLVLQDSIAKAIKDIIILHHRKKTGVLLDKAHLEIRFKSIVSIEALDFMELTVAATQTMSDIFGFLTNIAESSSVNFKINEKALLILVNRFMKTVDGVDGLLEVNNEPLVMPMMHDDPYGGQYREEPPRMETPAIFAPEPVYEPRRRRVADDEEEERETMEPAETPAHTPAAPPDESKNEENS
jgi:hypothetical protein